MMEFIFTKHAEEMIHERKISKVLVEETIISPDLSKNENGTKVAFKKVGSKVLKVVYRHENTYIIVTAYFDRRMKGKL